MVTRVAPIARLTSYAVGVSVAVMVAISTAVCANARIDRELPRSRVAAPSPYLVAPVVPMPMQAVESPVVVERGSQASKEKPYPTPTGGQIRRPTRWMQFKVTAYGNACAIEDPVTGKFGPSKTGLTASGLRGRHGMTVAADPSVFPRWSTIRIAGIGDFVVIDSGPKGRHIDLFLDSCEEARQFGRILAIGVRRIL